MNRSAPIANEALERTAGLYAPIEDPWPQRRRAARCPLGQEAAAD